MKEQKEKASVEHLVAEDQGDDSGSKLRIVNHGPGMSKADRERFAEVGDSSADPIEHE